jgi:hypothetical protein
VWNIFAVTGVLGAVYYLLRGASATGGLPLLHLLHGFSSVHSLAQTRLAFATGTTGYVYEFYGVILPVSAVAFMLRWLATGSRSHRRQALALLAVTGFTLVAAGYRGPVQLFFLTVAIGASYGLGGLRNKAGMALAVTAAGAFIALSAGIYSNPGVGSATGQATEARIFQVQAIGPQFVAQAYPSQFPYSDGADLARDLAGGLLHEHEEGFAEQLPALRGVKSLSNPVGAAFDAYVNFGPVGLAAVMFLLGWATVALHRRIAGMQAVSGIALGAGMSSALAAASVAGIAGTLLQYGVVTVALMAVVQRLARVREVGAWVVPTRLRWR